MQITCTINGKKQVADVDANRMAIDFLRDNGCLSVKRGCETSNCGLCSVLVDGKIVLSCSVRAASLDGKAISTLEGLQSEAKTIGYFLSEEGTEQCGYCTPGLIMAIIAMERELKDPTDEEILEYLSGNLCRCSGYQGQLRAIRSYLGGGINV